MLKLSEKFGMIKKEKLCNFQYDKIIYISTSIYFIYTN